MIVSLETSSGVQARGPRLEAPGSRRGGARDSPRLETRGRGEEEEEGRGGRRRKMRERRRGGRRRRRGRGGVRGMRRSRSRRRRRRSLLSKSFQEEGDPRRGGRCEDPKSSDLGSEILRSRIHDGPRISDPRSEDRSRIQPRRRDRGGGTPRGGEGGGGGGGGGGRRRKETHVDSSIDPRVEDPRSSDLGSEILGSRIHDGPMILDPRSEDRSMFFFVFFPDHTQGRLERPSSSHWLCARS